MAVEDFLRESKGTLKSGIVGIEGKERKGAEEGGGEERGGERRGGGGKEGKESRRERGEIRERR